VSEPAANDGGDREAVIVAADADRALAERLVAALRARGRIRCRLAPFGDDPEDGDGGQRIASAAALILILSDAAARDARVLRQVRRAAALGIAIVSLRIGAASPRGALLRYVELRAAIDAWEDVDDAQLAALEARIAGPDTESTRAVPRRSLRDHIEAWETRDEEPPPSHLELPRRRDDFTGSPLGADRGPAERAPPDARFAERAAAERARRLPTAPGGAGVVVLPPRLAAAVAARRRPLVERKSLAVDEGERPMAASAPPAAAAHPYGGDARPQRVASRHHAPARRAAPLGRLILIAALAAGALALGGWLGMKLFGLLGITGLRREDGGEVAPVDCSVYAPGEIARGDSVLVQVFVHAPDLDDAVAAAALAADPEAARRGFASLALDLVPGARMAFSLAVPGLVVADDAAIELVWRGRTQAAQFLLTAPPAAALGRAVATVRIAVDGVPAGVVRFVIEVKVAAAGGAQPQGESACRYSRAYVCYATPDRAEVLKRVQMLRRLGIDYFQDVLDLAPGQRWENALYRHIDASDLFLLFWSSNASSSEWVRKEVLYALERQTRSPAGAPEIVPVLLEGPPPVPPPPELQHLHFNDPILYFMAEHGAHARAPH
jgi:hypothetical protein